MPFRRSISPAIAENRRRCCCCRDRQSITGNDKCIQSDTPTRTSPFNRKYTSSLCGHTFLLSYSLESQPYPPSTQVYTLALPNPDQRSPSSHTRRRTRSFVLSVESGCSINRSCCDGGATVCRRPAEELISNGVNGIADYLQRPDVGV